MPGDVEAPRAAEAVGDDRVEVGRGRLLGGPHRPAGPQELGADEAVEVAVEHALGVAHLVVRAVVLDHRVRVQDVGADLRAEVHVLRLAALLGDLLLALALLELDQLGAQHLIAVSRLADCERSFWHCTTIPLGRWVMRTAESVLLTCWPPAPEAR